MISRNTRADVVRILVGQGYRSVTFHRNDTVSAVRGHRRAVVGSVRDVIGGNVDRCLAAWSEHMHAQAAELRDLTERNRARAVELGWAD